MANPAVGARTRKPHSPEGAQSRAARNPVDGWMDQTFKFGGSAVKRKTIALCLLGLPALAPVFFISRAIIELNSNTLDNVEADVLGTGSMLLLILTLTVTPMVTVTGQHWFVPLRKWYGVMIAVTATTDATLALFTGLFAGGTFGQVTAHTFLVAGFAMVLILLPLALISNNRAQRWLGRYWKKFQKLTYAVWFLLFVHLALLEGLGFQHGTNGPSASADGNPVLHQRVYQLAACSLPLLVLRLPPVKRWVDKQQREDRQWLVNLAVLPMAALYVLFFAFIVNEEIFKGVSAFRLQPVNG
jgi:DMSO/TMAO reductase YedYZ heme-binding membrane subunit